MSKRVYLSGPITGSSFKEVTEWRNEVKGHLENRHPGKIEVYSPLRGKEYLAEEREISCYAQIDKTLSTQRAIYCRDFVDTVKADLIFVNLLGSKRVSIGTMFEMAWASQLRIPILLVMEPIEAVSVHEHYFVREAADFRVTTVDEGIAITSRILFP